MNSVDDFSNQIRFYTSNTVYSCNQDTIKVFLENNTHSNIGIILKGGYPEMFYQRYKDDTWSINLWFWFTNLRSPSIPYTIENYSTYKHSIPSDNFDSTGTCRLLIDIDIPEIDTAKTVFSNTFKIK